MSALKPPVRGAKAGFNMSGDGAGFRNLDVQGYKLSYSYIFDRLDPPSASGGENVQDLSIKITNHPFPTVRLFRHSQIRDFEKHTSNLPLS